MASRRRRLVGVYFGFSFVLFLLPPNFCCFLYLLPAIIGEEGSEVEIQSANRRFHQSDQTEPTSIGSRVGKLIKLVIIFQLIQKT